MVLVRIMRYHLHYLTSVDYNINKLENYGLGCHFVNCYFGCLHADDLLLILSSVLDQQSVLDLCGIEGKYLGINLIIKS